eukprot:4682171-Amphidinium_carterae.2
MRDVHGDSLSSRAILAWPKTIGRFCMLHGCRQRTGRVTCPYSKSLAMTGLPFKLNQQCNQPPLKQQQDQQPSLQTSVHSLANSPY